MNDQELERRLRGWYRAGIDEDASAPPSLRAAVQTIPARTSVPWRTARRPALLLAAALAVVGIGAAFAVGSNLRLPNVSPVPPSNLAVLTPTPGFSTEATPAASPKGSQPTPTAPALSQLGFHAVGNLTTARYQHAATLLEDGRVLITGGSSLKTHVLDTTEIWDPATETSTIAPRLMVGRFGHKATRLLDGRVLIVGGYGPGDQGMRDIELYDPATGAFRAAGLTAIARNGSLSTVLLADGRVMLIGGINCFVRPGSPDSSAAARQACRQQQLNSEIWDPASESVTAAGSLEEEHDWASASLLDDGRVFVLGGSGLPTIGAEVWDPATGKWSHGGAPVEARMGGQTVTLLQDGRLLVVGGQTGQLNGGPEFPPPLRSAVAWDPATSSYSRAGSMALGRERHTATLLGDGRVLVVGGVGARAKDFSDTATPEAEIWDPTTSSFTSAGRDAVGRALHTATLLQDGRVLIAGGFARAEDGEIVTDNASLEIFTP
jgi:hypothetical protein